MGRGVLSCVGSSCSRADSGLPPHSWELTQLLYLLLALLKARGISWGWRLQCYNRSEWRVIAGRVTAETFWNKGQKNSVKASRFLLSVFYSVPAEPGLITRANACCSRAALAAVSPVGGDGESGCEGKSLAGVFFVVLLMHVSEQNFYGRGWVSAEQLLN